MEETKLALNREILEEERLYSLGRWKEGSSTPLSVQQRLETDHSTGPGHNHNRQS